MYAEIYVGMEVGPSRVNDELLDIAMSVDNYYQANSYTV